MNAQESNIGGYAFFSDGIQGKRFNFRTFTLWTGFEKHYREIRKASTVLALPFGNALEHFGDTYRWLGDEQDVVDWANIGGWALAAEDVAQTKLSPMMQPRTCVRSPLGFYTDVRFKKATSRHVHKRIRDRVLQRDGHTCLRCRRRASHQAKLTMHHVVPYSRGGETSEGNLVTLCEPCNQALGDSERPELLSLAGLHCRWDKSLVKAMAAPDAWVWATQLSSNIVVSFCEMRELLPVKGLPASVAQCADTRS